MQFGVTGYRDLTTSFQSTQKCPFGHHPLPGGPITYGFHKGPDVFVVLANFETHGPLTYSRQHGTDGQILRNEVLQSQTLNARPGHNQSLTITVLHFLNTRLHISTNVHQLQIGIVIEQLGLATETRVADFVVASKVVQTSAIARQKHVADFSRSEEHT